MAPSHSSGEENEETVTSWGASSTSSALIMSSRPQILCVSTVLGARVQIGCQMVWWKGPPLGHHQVGTIGWWSQYQGKAPRIPERPLDLHKPLSSRPGVSKWTHTGIWWNVGWVAAVALWLGTGLDQLRKRVLLRYHGGAVQLRPVDAKGPEKQCQLGRTCQ